MRHFGRRHGWWLIALAAFLVVGSLRLLGALEPLDRAFAEQRSRWLLREVRSDIVIVGLDAASLAELQQWPLPRRHYGDLVRQLATSSPRGVFLDVDFSSLSDDLNDALLESA